MPLFRRSKASPSAVEFTVGVHDHRVVVEGPQSGNTLLADLHDYVGSVTGHASQPRSDGRDSVAVLSAKMDYAELVSDLATAIGLAFEELCALGVVDPSEVPRQAPLPPVPERTTHYAYIQATFQRAEVRYRWLEEADAVLIRHSVAVLPPKPPEDTEIRLR